MEAKSALAFSGRGCPVAVQNPCIFQPKAVNGKTEELHANILRGGTIVLDARSWEWLEAALHLQTLASFATLSYLLLAPRARRLRLANFAASIGPIREISFSRASST